MFNEETVTNSEKIVRVIPKHNQKKEEMEDMPSGKQKILFIGAGAVCSYLGASLTHAGHDVTLVDAWADQIEAIRARGIHATGPHEPIDARPKAVHLIEAAQLGSDFNMVFVGLKAYDTAWATQLALRHLPADGFVVSAQNCWVDPIVASVAGPARSDRPRDVQDLHDAHEARLRRAGVR